MIHTTEIASSTIASDNPIHQRLLFAYVEAAKHVSGNLLDIGCGEGRGLDYLRDNVDSYTGIDKNPIVLDALKKQYPNDTFLQMNIPPFAGLEDNTFDTAVSFQVVEHIEDDVKYIKEIHRVLKPGGIAILSTPNIKMSLTRNPWHVREYTCKEFENLLSKQFSSVECLGVYGDDAVMQYFEENKRGVEKFTRFDIFNLQYKLPRKWLEVPYNIANRMNRKKIMDSNDSLVNGINIDSFTLDKADDTCFDLFYIARK
ncbi:MAG: class I SAM-dependent methyltransferase [Chitinophagales bacterium]